MKLFITGIGTNVGKTIASAIITQSLEADYWKPIQAGDLDNSDSATVKKLISNSKSKIHPSSYNLNTPASPHMAAQLDGITIELTQIKEPKTTNHLIIEGAGGLLVPLNNQDSIIDLIQDDYQVILVSSYYLGSINHTLLSYEALQSRNISCAGIIFSGEENLATKTIILEKTGLHHIGTIEQEPYFDTNVVQYYAHLFHDTLINL